MVRRSISVCVAVGLSATALAAPKPAEPTSKWSVNYAETECVATRQFGGGDRPISLSLKPAHSGGSVRVMVITKKGFGQPDYMVEVDFLDGRPAFSTKLMPTFVPEPFRIGYQFDLPPAENARFRAAGAIRIVARGILDRRFETGSFGPLFKALDQCLADLRRVWGGPPEGQVPAMRAEPVGDLSEMFREKNYPVVSLHDPKRKSVAVRLLVDERGKVRDCLVMEGSGSAARDIQTCQFVERDLLYRPARDASGKEIRSIADATIDWRR